MFTNSVIARLPFVLATALVATPLAAQDEMVVSSQKESVYQERVSISDLDLRQWSAQQVLKARVSRASERVCNEAEGPFATRQFGLGSSMSCADHTYSDAKPQIAAAIARAKSGQPQLATALVIQGPAITR